MSLEYYLLGLAACAMMLSLTVQPVTETRVAQTAAMQVGAETGSAVAGRSTAGVMETLPR